MKNPGPGKKNAIVTKVTRKRVFAEFVNSKCLHVPSSDLNTKRQTWLCCDETFTVTAEIHKHVSKHHSEAVNQATTKELLKLNQDCHKDCHDISKVATCQCQQERSSSINDLQNVEYGKERCHNISKESQQNRQDAPVAMQQNRQDALVAMQHNRQDALVTMQENNFQSKRQCCIDLKNGENHEGQLPWLLSVEECHNLEKTGEGQILLYYKYIDIANPSEVADWQRELCQRLHLTGKIRLATEGLNGTVGGALEATELYIKAVINHPLFDDMTSLDFKKSKGDSSHFPKGLKVGVHQEIVPMGVSPEALSYKQAGKHLTPDEFHRELDRELQSQTAQSSNDTLFLDCRNFYESKIGQFKGAVTPNIRKFSYWPEYVDKNLDLFQDKRVIMYCTGGIRCERGSAYLNSKSVCKEILQLKGGVHNYLNEYPDGHFRGKLFVFDDRYAIGTSKDIVANCFHCDRPWDKYQPCSSTHCHIFVLACPECRDKALTACCKLCSKLNDLSQHDGIKTKEDCLCTRGRERIPIEK